MCGHFPADIQASMYRINIPPIRRHLVNRDTILVLHNWMFHCGRVTGTECFYIIFHGSYHTTILNLNYNNEHQKHVNHVDIYVCVYIACVEACELIRKQYSSYSANIQKCVD